MTSFGQIAGVATLQLGREISLMTSKEKTVYTHLVLSISMNGTTLSVATAISTLARKVGYKSLFIKTCFETEGSTENLTLRNRGGNFTLFYFTSMAPY